MLEERNFTVEEIQAIEKIKERTIHYLTPRLLKDKTFYYRFLKAREFNLGKTELLIQKHLQDRAKYQLDPIPDSYSTPEHISKYFPVTVFGLDKQGDGLIYADAGHADFKGITSLFTFYELVRHASYHIEDCLSQTNEFGKSATQIVVIFNMDEFSIFQATYKKSIEYIIEGLMLFQDNYPERVKAVYIINSSFYFLILFSVLKKVISGRLLSKIHIFAKTGWQDALLDVIDEDVIPAFLGGTRTDPDKNHSCNTFIVHGEKIPEYLYLKNRTKTLNQEPAVKKLSIARLSQSEIEISVCKPETRIEWEFETKEGDIAFGLYYKMKNTALEELIPKQRINTKALPGKGTYKCDNIGTYIFTFDNSYSWMYSKEIYYRLNFVEPQG